MNLTKTMTVFLFCSIYMSSFTSTVANPKKGRILTGESEDLKQIAQKGFLLSGLYFQNYDDIQKAKNILSGNAKVEESVNIKSLVFVLESDLEEHISQSQEGATAVGVGIGVPVTLTCIIKNKYEYSYTYPESLSKALKTKKTELLKSIIECQEFKLTPYQFNHIALF
jgi:hypothetical protein